jgi:hypothetical protein
MVANHIGEIRSYGSGEGVGRVTAQHTLQRHLSAGPSEAPPRIPASSFSWGEKASEKLAPMLSTKRVRSCHPHGVQGGSLV